MSDKLDLVLKEIQEIKKEIQSVKTEQKQQGDLTIQLLHIVKATNEKVSGAQEDIKELKQDIATIKEDVSVLKKDVRSFKEGQTRQERILKSLALRSIEQEQDLLELKHVK